MESFIHPGGEIRHWTSRGNFTAFGVVQTGPAEMSLYTQRRNGQVGAYLERLTLRLDGIRLRQRPLRGGRDDHEAVPVLGPRAGDQLRDERGRIPAHRDPGCRRYTAAGVRAGTVRRDVRRPQLSGSSPGRATAISAGRLQVSSAALHDEGRRSVLASLPVRSGSTLQPPSAVHVIGPEPRTAGVADGDVHLDR